MPNVATQNLTFIAGTFDISSPYGTSVPLLEEVRQQAPQAVCELTSTNVSRNLILNPQKPPFDNADLRRAVALSLDRQAFIDIETQGKGDIGATMLPPPEGLWGMPPEMLATLPGYNPDIATNRAEARKIMEKLGYGPDHRLAVTLSSRNLPADYLLPPRRHLHAALCQGPDDHGQQHLQRLSHGRRLARQIAAVLLLRAYLLSLRGTQRRSNLDRMSTQRPEVASLRSQ